MSKTRKITVTALLLILIITSCCALQTLIPFNARKNITYASETNYGDYFNNYYMGNVEPFREYVFEQLDIETDYETDEEAVLLILEALGK